MKFNKNILKYIATAIVATWALSACNNAQEDALNLPQGQAQQEERLGDLFVDLTVEASVGDEARAMKFLQSDAGVVAKLQPKLPADGVEVLCIVRSSDPNDAPIYRTIKFERNETVENRIHLKGHRFRFPEGTTTKAGKKWYIMGLIGGTWDEGQKRLSFQTNQITKVGLNDLAEIDAPAISKWVEIPTKPDGSFVFRPKGSTEPCVKIPFHAQGALVRHSVGETSGNFTSFTVVSTAFSFGGYYDLAQLPNVDNSGHGDKHSTAFNFVHDNPHEQEYAVSRAGVNEYSHKFTLPQATKLSNDYTTLFWVMPTGTATDQARTNVFIEGQTSVGARSVSFKRLPVYGKLHSKVLKSGQQVHIQSEVNRPEYPIEFMASHNVRRKNNWDVNSGTRPTGSTGQFATNHGPEAASGLTWEEAMAAGIAGYHLPTLPEWESVVLAGSNFKMRTSSVQNFDVKVKVGARAEETVGVQTKGDEPNKTLYAIHFINAGGNNKRRVAYRYRFVRNPDLQPTTLKAPTIVNLDGTMEYDEQDGPDDKINKVIDPTGVKIPPYNFPLSEEYLQYLQIDMIYLGEGFLGTIEDLAKPAWWEHEERKQDITTKYLPSFGYIYHMHVQYYEVNEQGRQQRSTIGYANWTFVYWLNKIATALDGKTKVQSRIPEPGRYAHCSFLSAYSGSAHTQQRLKDKNYLNVRLFKDASN